MKVVNSISNLHTDKIAIFTVKKNLNLEFALVFYFRIKWKICTEPKFKK